MPPVGPATRAFAAALLAVATTTTLAAIVPPADPAPVVEPAPLSAYDRFELVDPLLDTGLLGPDGNERARRELQMELHDALGPWLEARNAEAARGVAPRVLRIEPTIVLLAYVDPAVRYSVGPLPGTERLHVRVRFVDAATGEAVAESTFETEGSALADVAPLGATSAALPRQVAKDLAEYLSGAVAGATAPATTE